MIQMLFKFTSFTISKRVLEMTFQIAKRANELSAD